MRALVRLYKQLAQFKGSRGQGAPSPGDTGHPGGSEGTLHSEGVDTRDLEAMMVEGRDGRATLDAVIDKHADDLERMRRVMQRKLAAQGVGRPDDDSGH